MEEKKLNPADKYYFKVQDVERKSCGYKTHTTSVKGVTLYDKEDFVKAARHANKKAANQIILTKVEILDEMPYAKETVSFGEKTTKFVKDGKLLSFADDITAEGVESHKIIYFKDFGIYIDAKDKEIREYKKGEL